MSLLPDLICFSHLRWNFVWQRPQHLMTRAARTRRVWFVEEAETTDESDCFLEFRTITPTLSVVVPKLSGSLTATERLVTHTQLLAELVDACGPRPRVLWFYSPMFHELTEGLPAGVVVYDCMDELSAFAGAPTDMPVREGELMARCDLVFTGGASLYEAKRGRHPRTFRFPSGVDVAHFQTARETLPDHDAQQALPRPRIGFAGVLDERLDRELLAELAALRPDYSFVLVGPVVKISPDVLPCASNLHYVGMQAYQDLPRFLAHWDVGILPFARNASTRFISPTKTPEYLAAGLPVVSTSIATSSVRTGIATSCRLPDAPEAFAAALDLALAPARAGWREEVDHHLTTLSWDQTWEQMHFHISEGERIATAGVPPSALEPPAASPAHAT